MSQFLRGLKRRTCAAMTLAAAAALAGTAHAALIAPFDTVDLADGFVQTGPYQSALSNTNNRPDRFYGENSAYYATTNPPPNNSGVAPENTYGSYNLTTNNTGQRAVFDRAGLAGRYNAFSFNLPTPDSANDSRPISAFSYNDEYSSYENGFAQSGGGDSTVQYGLRDRYLVQMDAILPSDRLDLSSGLTVAGGLGTRGSLSVFFRKVSRSIQAFGNSRNIDIYNGVTDTQLSFGNGVDDDNWHNFAVEFDRANNRLRIYTDNVLNGEVDLNTFAPDPATGLGRYKDFSTATVGFGGNGVFYGDNFTVSGIGPLPEPTSLGCLAVVGTALVARRGSRRTSAQG